MISQKRQKGWDHQWSPCLFEGVAVRRFFANIAHARFSWFQRAPMLHMGVCWGSKNGNLDDLVCGLTCWMVHECAGQKRSGPNVVWAKSCRAKGCHSRARRWIKSTALDQPYSAGSRAQRWINRTKLDQESTALNQKSTALNQEYGAESRVHR